jgi:transcriptional regulator with XRE-family HTH domain
VDRLHRRVAHRINQVRKAKKLSQNYLADFAGLSRAQMSRILNGQQSPTLRTLQKIAEALELDLRLLLNGD